MEARVASAEPIRRVVRGVGRRRATPKPPPPYPSPSETVVSCPFSTVTPTHMAERWHPVGEPCKPERLGLPRSWRGSRPPNRLLGFLGLCWLAFWGRVVRCFRPKPPSRSFAATACWGEPDTLAVRPGDSSGHSFPLGARPTARQRLPARWSHQPWRFRLCGCRPGEWRPQWSVGL